LTRHGTSPLSFDIFCIVPLETWRDSVALSPFFPSYGCDQERCCAAVGAKDKGPRTRASVDEARECGLHPALSIRGGSVPVYSDLLASLLLRLLFFHLFKFLPKHQRLLPSNLSGFLYNTASIKIFRDYSSFQPENTSTVCTSL
jgi:hypothetical protein